MESNTVSKKSNKAWIIVFAVLVPAVILFSLLSYVVYSVYDYHTYVPEYSSTATLYVLKQQNDLETTRQDYEEFELEEKLINDCNHLLKSHTVLDEVINNLDLDMSYSKLRDSISVHNPEKSRILEITVTADTPENAKRIVDQVCDVGVTKITEAMGFKQVYLMEYGILNIKPANERFNIIQMIVDIFE